jgi:hypothetical protein
MIVHTPLGEAGASPSQRPDKSTDGAQEMAVWIEKWNYPSSHGLIHAIAL